MLKAMHGQEWLCGVSRGSVLSSKVRHGLSWQGKVLSGRVQHGDVWHCVVWRGLSRRGFAWLDIVRSCLVRFCDVRRGLIEVLRGMALYSTVLSCPVRRSKATSGKAFRGMVSLGGAGSCPDGSSGVWFCKVRCFLVRSGCVGWGTVERGFVLQGTALSWQGGVEQSEVRYGKLSLWMGEVLIGVVGFVGARLGKVKALLRRGVVWSVEALHGIAKFGPVKHCLVGLGVILVRRGTEGLGFARLRAVGRALVRRYLALS